jgi:predicted nucleic acid-binding protein
MIKAGLTFLDTAGLLAYIRVRDARRARAVEVLADLIEGRSALVTTDWVLSEFLAGAASVPLRGGGFIVTERLLRSPRVQVLPATRRDFLRALELYRERQDKAWSLVDCSSMLACERLKIRRVFTSDRDFEQAGFDALLI